MAFGNFIKQLILNLMKSIKLIIIAAFLTISNNYAQDAEYFDAPFGGGGGFTPGWFIPDMDVLNNSIKQFSVPEFSNGGFYTSGGSGFIYIGFIPNLRIGGMGFGGSTSESSFINGENREAIYSIGGGGLTVEYTLPFVKNLGVSIGFVLGGGSLQIEFFKNKGPVNFDDILNDLSGNFSDNQNKKMENSYWIFSPTLNLEIPVFRFLAFRIGGGYQFTFSEDWSLDNGVKLSGVPEGINSRNFYIQTGVFVGFFSF